MKKFNFKKLLSVALVLVVVAGLVGGVVAIAEANNPQVLFDGSAGAFKFKNATPFKTETSVDLFSNIKGIVPGDSFTQTFTIGAENIGTGTVTMQLIAQNPNADYLKLMGEGSASVAHPAILTVRDGTTVISETALTAAGGFSLGTFSNNQTKELTVQLSVPVEAGNELSSLTAKIDWVFKATVAPAQPSGDTEELGDIELDKTNHFGYIVGRGNNCVQPNENITRAEVATIFFRMLTDESRTEFWSQSNSYSDVTSTAWYNNAISTLTKGEVLEGYGNGEFKPNGFITRAEFATMVTRFYQESGVYSADAFTDISGSWARNYINRAAELGLISGYGDGTFRPNQNITRAEAMQLINNVLERCPVKEHFLSDMITWLDNMDTSKWYYATVQEATNSHDYDFVTDNVSNKTHEVWKEILTVRDWTALEKQWYTANSSQR